MTGLLELAAGPAWTDLHPAVRERYGIDSRSEQFVFGTGVMDRIDRSTLAIPALWVGTHDDLLFPEAGMEIPFAVWTVPFTDSRGHEALFMERRFETDPPRRFVDTLRWNPERGCITDFLGRSGRVSSDVHVAEQGGSLSLTLGDQWLRLGRRHGRLPGSLSLSGQLRDSYDEGEDSYRVEATITAPVVGTVFGYRGSFSSDRCPLEDLEPRHTRLGTLPLP